MSDAMTQIPADVRERVLTMLTAMEWAALIEHHDGRWYACCPWCGGENPDDDETPPGRAGHAERCELAAVIALLRASRGEGEAEAESGGDVTVSQLLAVLDEYNAEVFCMTPENADGTPMFSVAIARGESVERLKQWANEAAEESAALRSEAQGEERASKYGALLAFADAISDAVWGGERAWEQDGGLERLSQKVRRWAKERAALRSEAQGEGWQVTEPARDIVRREMPETRATVREAIRAAIHSETPGVTRCRICCERPAALTLCTECADEALWRSIYDQWLAEEATNARFRAIVHEWRCGMCGHWSPRRCHARCQRCGAVRGYGYRDREAVEERTVITYPTDRSESDE